MLNDHLGKILEKKLKNVGIYDMSKLMKHRCESALSVSITFVNANVVQLIRDASRLSVALV